MYLFCTYFYILTLHIEHFETFVLFTICCNSLCIVLLGRFLWEKKHQRNKQKKTHRRAATVSPKAGCTLLGTKGFYVWAGGGTNRVGSQRCHTSPEKGMGGSFWGFVSCTVVGNQKCISVLICPTETLRLVLNTGGAARSVLPPRLAAVSLTLHHWDRAGCCCGTPLHYTV